VTLYKFTDLPKYKSTAAAREDHERRCPACGGDQFRQCGDLDERRCPCGFTVSGQVICYARDKADPAWHMLVNGKMRFACGCMLALEVFVGDIALALAEHERRCHQMDALMDQVRARMERDIAAVTSTTIMDSAAESKVGKMAPSKTECPSCGKPADKVDFGLGVTIIGCECVPSDRVYAVRIGSPTRWLEPVVYDPGLKPVVYDPVQNKMISYGLVDMVRTAVYNSDRAVVDDYSKAVSVPEVSRSLDVEYDGMTLRDLLAIDRLVRMETVRGMHPFTPSQRAAISAHWSAELRAKITAGKQAERARVVVDQEDP
jgi:ssDNA-binding Zn-finger/Zn-ribbon topoisomerase 1